MLSFRDRFFTPTVSTAMLSPSAILAGGAGAAIGVLLGGFGGLVGAVLGGVFGAVIGWAIRVALAVPRAPEGLRIDPFTVSEPWRRFVQDAVGAKAQFNDAVRRTKRGPIRDRLTTIGARIDETVAEAWQAAVAGHELSDAARRVDANAARSELATLIEARSDAAVSVTAQATIAALEAQIATGARMEAQIAATRDQLRLLNARLDEAVARSIELSVGTDELEAFTDVEGAVGTIGEELEALRSAIEDTSAIERGTPQAQGQ